MTFGTLFKLALACALATSAAVAPAQNRGPVTILVGFAPGGTSDSVARLLASKLPEQLDRTVVVENKAGGLGVLAINELIATPPGRSTFLLVPFSTIVFPVLVQSSLRYDIFKDLQAVASLTSFPLGVAVNPATGVRTPRELAAWLKEHPANAQFGTAGAGGHNHFLSLQLGKAIGIDVAVVPYKGNGPLLTDLIGGHIPAGVMVAGELTPYVKDERLRIVGVLAAERSPLVPAVPTFVEQGIAVQSGEAWYGMWASANAGKVDVEQMQEALRKILTTPDMRDTLAAKFAMNADFRPADQTTARLRGEYDHWAPIIRESGFKVD